MPFAGLPAIQPLTIEEMNDIILRLQVFFHKYPFFALILVYFVIYIG